MGFYDSVVLDDNDIVQLKCWDNPSFRGFMIGSQAPSPVEGKTTYSILLYEEGIGYLNVTEGVIRGASENPIHPHIFDKWGNDISNDGDHKTYYERENTYVWAVREMKQKDGQEED